MNDDQQVRLDKQMKLAAEVRKLFDDGQILSEVFKFVLCICDNDTFDELVRDRGLITDDPSTLEFYTDPRCRLPYLNFNDFVESFKWVLKSDEYNDFKKTGVTGDNVYPEIKYTERHDELIKQAIETLQNLINKHEYTRPPRYIV